MAIYQTDWHWFTGWGNGYSTIDVNIAPAWIGAEVALHGTTGDGTQYAGIRHYRKRLGSGADEDHDFGDWTSWPAVIFDYVSSITFAIATGSDQEGWLKARMDYWT
ncbi:MAG: hypothetical protein ACM3JB_11845 [Acidobacteriaceae bacterium]